MKLREGSEGKQDDWKERQEGDGKEMTKMNKL